MSLSFALITTPTQDGELWGVAVDQREGSWTYPIIIGLLVGIAAKLHVFSTGEPRLPLLLTVVAAALAFVVAWIVLSYLSRLVPEVFDLAKTAWKTASEWSQRLPLPSEPGWRRLILLFRLF